MLWMHVYSIYSFGNNSNELGPSLQKRVWDGHFAIQSGYWSGSLLVLSQVVDG